MFNASFFFCFFFYIINNINDFPLTIASKKSDFFEALPVYNMYYIASGNLTDLRIIPHAFYVH